MNKQEFLCMALDCKNTVTRHPYNFGTGFCKECQKEYNKKILEIL